MKSLELHTKKTHHVSCGVFCITEHPEKLSIDYYKAYITYVKMTNWASIHENEDCVKSTINRLYWEAVKKVEAEEDESQILFYLLIGAGAAVLLAGIVLAFLCCKMKGGDDGEGAKGFTEDD